MGLLARPREYGFVGFSRTADNARHRGEKFLTCKLRKMGKMSGLLLQKSRAWLNSVHGRPGGRGLQIPHRPPPPRGGNGLKQPKISEVSGVGPEGREVWFLRTHVLVSFGSGWCSEVDSGLSFAGREASALYSPGGKSWRGPEERPFGLPPGWVEVLGAPTGRPGLASALQRGPGREGLGAWVGGRASGSGPRGAGRAWGVRGGPRGRGLVCLPSCSSGEYQHEH